MTSKKFYLPLLFITTVWLFDYSCMGKGVKQDTRLIAHIVALCTNIFIGYIAYKSRPWAMYIWLGVYFTILLIITTIGLLYKANLPISENMLLDVSNIRLLFTSPIPFAALYIISIQDKSNKEAK